MTPPGPVAELRVVGGGEPTADELAALVLAVTAAAAEAGRRETQAGRQRGGWASRSAGLRRPPHAGVGAWRAYL